MANNPTPQLEDVLDAFSVEPDHGKETLGRYLQDYPQYANEIVDLSFELSKPINQSDTPWSTNELAEIEAAWQKHGKAMLISENPFEAISIQQLRQIATDLDVPRSVISAFRERQVIITSVPQKFLRRLATALGQTMEGFLAFAESIAPTSISRSYKSNVKPQSIEQITFETLLIQSQVPEVKRKKLLSEE